MKVDIHNFKPLDSFCGRPLVFSMGLYDGVFLGRCKDCETNHVFSIKEVDGFAFDDKFVGILESPIRGGFPAFNK